MAYEDSHTLFVVTWLRKVGLEPLLHLWYTYREDLEKEKRRHPRRKVYSSLYEFFEIVTEHFPKNELLSSAYDETIDELQTIEKMIIPLVS